MDNLHSSKSIIKYGMQYVYLSVFMTIGLVLYAYWDIIKLRYASGFFEFATVSTGGQELFISGFKNNLSSATSTFLPIVITFLLASLVAYTFYNSYKFTLQDLDVNYNFVNVKKVNTMHIVTNYVAIYTASFVLPLLFWCLYFTYIFPALVKVPLNYIVGSSTLKFSIVAGLVLVALVVITQFGLVITRLTTKILRKR